MPLLLSGLYLDLEPRLGDAAGLGAGAITGSGPGAGAITGSGPGAGAITGSGPGAGAITGAGPSSAGDSVGAGRVYEGDGGAFGPAGLPD